MVRDRGTPGAVVTLPVALVLILVACAPAPRPPSPAAPSATVPSSAQASAGQASSPTPGWERSPDQAAFADTGFTGVAWTGSRFLATTGPVDRSIMDSGDGRTWHRQPPFQPTPWTAGPGLVAAGPGGAIAVGGGNGGPVAMWGSDDGLTWSRLPDQPAFQARDGAFGGVDALVPTDGGWLGVGGELYLNAPTLALQRGVVLVSADGRRWTRVPDQPSLEHAQLNGVVQVPAGYIAVGAVVADPSRADSGLRAAVWTSPDGLVWTRVDSPQDFPAPEVAAGHGPVDVVLHAIAAQGDRLVAIGEMSEHGDAAGSGAVMAWWSDGDGWTPAPIEPVAPHAPLSLAAVPGAFYAFVGSDAWCRAGAWIAVDGSAWQCLDEPTFDGFEVTGVAVAPDRMALVGRGDAPDGSMVAAAWTHQLP